MPTKNVVREILPEQVKDVNPYEIIYLAMKDGSVIMIADKEDEKFESLDLNYSIGERNTKQLFTYDKIQNSKKKTNSINKNYSNKSFHKNQSDCSMRSNKAKNSNLNYTFNYSNQYEVTNSTFNHNNSRGHSQDMNQSISMKNYKQVNNSKYTFDNNPFRQNSRSISQKPKIGNNHNYLGDTKHYYQVRGDYYKKQDRPLSNIRNNDKNNNCNNNIFSVSNSIFTDTKNNNLNNNTFNASIERKLINSNQTQPVQKEEYLEVSFEQKSVKTENMGGYYENRKGYNDGCALCKNNAMIRSQSFDVENNKKFGGRVNHICNNDNMGVHKILDPNCPMCRKKAKEMNLDLISVGDGIFYDNHSYYQSYGFSGENKKYNHSPGRVRSKYYFQEI